MAEGEFALVQEILESAQLRASQPTRFGATARAHDIVTSLADAAAGRHDGTAALKYGAQAAALASEMGHPLYLAVAQRALAVGESLQGAHDQAEALLRKALDAFTDLGTRWQIGRTHLQFGELERARDRQAEARQHYLAALVEFEAMGALPDAERTRQALSAHG
jgi:tetratricopeptide (TPR) repeat protein